ncbi:hypothetical protein IGA63_30035, partial [Pseudomonas aeruginosa]|nr:hypothetical protein [Pseudomonas aeruginosa]
MAITALPSADGQELTIQIQGRFDFGAHQDFRDAYERVAEILMGPEVEAPL